MARSIWKGAISFGLVNVPVGLYAAESRSDVHFTMLDSRNKAHVRYQRVNEITGEQVPWDAVVKAYEYDDGDFVVVTDEDFKRASVEATQTVEIEDFVDKGAVDYVYFDKPYYLVPGKKGEKGYVLLRETLRRTNKVGIARVVIRSKEHLAALIPEGNALVLDLIRFKQELRDPSEYNLPGENLDEYKVSPKEIDMAEKLVEAMSSEWEPDKYHDKYQEKLMEYIEQKIREGRGEEVPEPTPAPEPQARVIDMMDLLKQSVEATAQSRGKKNPEKAGARKRRKVG
ncbi:MAG: Ku protein [Chitinivibrionales bacterium]